jgi:hypothetical protein
MTLFVRHSAVGHSKINIPAILASNLQKTFFTSLLPLLLLGFRSHRLPILYATSPSGYLCSTPMKINVYGSFDQLKRRSCRHMSLLTIKYKEYLACYKLNTNLSASDLNVTPLELLAEKLLTSVSR